MGRDKVSTWNLIVLFVIVFAIANVAFAVTMIAMGGDNRAIIKEFAMTTGIMVAFNSVLLIIADCCVMIERGRWNRKSQVDCFAGETYQLLKCSAKYYVLVASTLFLDFGLAWQMLRHRSCQFLWLKSTNSLIHSHCEVF